MARIRTIKPEFPQSESMGRVSRDARLCFVMMWTIADDSGRLRGNSRMLASLLFPYDDDAPALIDGWLDELEREGCVHRYMADGSTYIEIANWLSHQKIDKPTPSKIPAFDPSSRILANPRESSSLDRKGEEGIKEGNGEGSTSDEVEGDEAEAASSARVTQLDACPHQAIVDAFHRILPTARHVRDWTPARQALLRSRWREDRRRQSLEWWERFFAYVGDSKFLTGRAPTQAGRKPFELGLEWLLKPENFAKVREGAFHDEAEVHA